MSRDTLPSISDVLNNAASSRWLRTVLQDVIADGRDAHEAARDACLLAAVLDARATASGKGDGPSAPSSHRASMVDLLLPLVESDQVTADVRPGAQPYRSPTVHTMHVR